MHFRAVAAKLYAPVFTGSDPDEKVENSRENSCVLDYYNICVIMNSFLGGTFTYINKKHFTVIEE